MPAQSSQLTNTADLNYLFTHHLNQLYFGKKYIKANIQHLINIASFSDLKLALTELSDDVDKQLARLDEIYKLKKITPSDKECIPIQALFKDTFALERKGIGMALLGDMDIMLYMQLVEHINITAYRTLRIIANALEFNDIEQMFIESFDESVDDDRLFMLITNEYLTAQPNAR